MPSKPFKSNNEEINKIIEWALRTFQPQELQNQIQQREFKNIGNIPERDMQERELRIRDNQGKIQLVTNWKGILKTLEFNQDMSNVFIAAQDSPSIDAFGRWRTSEPYTIFDSKQIFDNQPLLYDDQEVSGGSTSSTHSTAEAASTISVANTTAGKRVRQTFRSFNYQPGKSQLVFLTFSEFDTTTGITKEVGLFDDNNGLFLRSDEGTVSVVRRTKVTGSVVDNVVAQTSWNMDTMNGQGSSGVNLDFTKSQIFVIDFEWLGVGRVRFGFVVDGIIYYCHEVKNANSLATVYMSTPNLPIRYSIENDGNGAADDFVHICSSVMSEGGQQDTGVYRYISTEGTHLDANTENTIYGMIGIRLKSTALNEQIDLLGETVALFTASSAAEWSLIWNPTVAGTPTWNDMTNSAIQYSLGATANTVTNGYHIAGGHVFSSGVAAGGSGSISGEIRNTLKLGASISGTPDEIWLCVRPINGSTNIDVEGSLRWRELS